MFRNLARWWRTRRILKQCGCVCFCECGNPLNDGPWATLETEGAATVTYVCRDCGRSSSFDFSGPVPIKVDGITPTGFERKGGA